MVLDFPEGEIVAIMGPSGGGSECNLPHLQCCNRLASRSHHVHISRLLQSPPSSTS